MIMETVVSAPSYWQAVKTGWKAYWSCFDCKGTGINQTYNTIDPAYEMVCGCKAGAQLLAREAEARKNS